MKKVNFILIFISCVFASFIGSWIFTDYFDKPETIVINSPPDIPKRIVNNDSNSDLENGFVDASKKTTPSVVFIKTESQQYQRQSFWSFGFDPFGRIGKVASTGSGVIVSDDGYIVTNHHVIKNADKIEVVLSNKRLTYQANLVGADPSSDLAMLKIETENLTPIQFANSDDLEIGEWVLAVGNPFNLTSTVTAGIVSAKGRNINIVNNQFPIESFIQTDAAINPGNSGGALVDLEGNLVGVNTAIASKTGSYVGYGFAIPANIVGKIIEDLKNYGELQRGFIGVDVSDIDGSIIAKLGAEYGVLVSRSTGTNESASRLLEAGDLIQSINGYKVETKADFDERIAYLRPGDKAKLMLIRDKKAEELEIVLVNKEGTTDLLVKNSKFSEILGAEFELISKLDRSSYKIENGVKVTNITNGKIRKMSLSEGFIFVKINNKKCTDVDDLIEYLESYQGQVRIEGVNANGSTQYLSFNFY